ncbi:MAG TPA: pilus assembly protein [Firmicutes bacterium]|jgi:Flp pilus assembly protein TadG|nr:pilus assembly protein [Bacillota bacterium]HOQ23111.1 TadE/TadG family type IV pilus assembly protein [Bacillota bacterium]HPT67008.1 TadE/TadG family type IV pilus assembly protein [Bacillota bacterium]
MTICWRQEKGSAMVEFALVITLFLMLFMGLVEFGRIFHAQLTLDNAARQGARVAAVGYSDAQVRAAVKSVATQLNLEDSDITITPSTRQKFDPVTVKVQTELPLIVPIISGLLQNPFPVSGQATMMMEK